MPCLDVCSFRLLNPRKGTETFETLNEIALFQLSANLIPARGLKQQEPELVFILKANDTFRLLNPRKGTETLNASLYSCLSSAFRLLNPRKGTETSQLGSGKG